ncbi:universal stress protein [Aquabacterium sp. A7-Y]|uniref:universal stress protein n=1 Tax=Aquabacterium sp. A7-Y TaxID=1349605 RepID=UPI00223E1B7E|nr:universal stress protein [Aquabacterium sp. A7-Y]MCW7541193.1 universal stress protein [Aquabacterium sp. A7-Y]
MKILLPVDGSTYTKRMLGFVAAHDEMFGTSHDYTALTVVPAVPPHAAGFLDKGLLDSYYQEEAEKVLSPVRQFAVQTGWRLETRYAVGHAGDVVAELAQEGRYDLMVMGTHGHSALGSVVLGSVTTRVIASCKVPLLLVR